MNNQMISVDQQFSPYTDMPSKAEKMNEVPVFQQMVTEEWPTIGKEMPTEAPVLATRMYETAEYTDWKDGVEGTWDFTDETEMEIEPVTERVTLCTDQSKIVWRSDVLAEGRFGVDDNAANYINSNTSKSVGGWKETIGEIYGNIYNNMGAYSTANFLDAAARFIYSPVTLNGIQTGKIDEEETGVDETGAEITVFPIANPARNMPMTETMAVKDRVTASQCENGQQREGTESVLLDMNMTPLRNGMCQRIDLDDGETTMYAKLTNVSKDVKESEAFNKCFGDYNTSGTIIASDRFSVYGDGINKEVCPDSNTYTTDASWTAPINMSEIEQEWVKEYTGIFSPTTITAYKAYFWNWSTFEGKEFWDETAYPTLVGVPNQYYRKVGKQAVNLGGVVAQTMTTETPYTVSGRFGLESGRGYLMYGDISGATRPTEGFTQYTSYKFRGSLRGEGELLYDAPQNMMTLKDTNLIPNDLVEQWNYYGWSAMPGIIGQTTGTTNLPSKQNTKEQIVTASPDLVYETFFYGPNPPAKAAFPHSVTTCELDGNSLELTNNINVYYNFVYPDNTTPTTAKLYSVGPFARFISTFTIDLTKYSTYTVAHAGMMLANTYYATNETLSANTNTNCVARQTKEIFPNWVTSVSCKNPNFRSNDVPGLCRYSTGSLYDPKYFGTYSNREDSTLYTSDWSPLVAATLVTRSSPRILSYTPADPQFLYTPQKVLENDKRAEIQSTFSSPQMVVSGVCDGMEGEFSIDCNFIDSLPLENIYWGGTDCYFNGFMASASFNYPTGFLTIYGRANSKWNGTSGGISDSTIANNIPYFITAGTFNIADKTYTTGFSNTSYLFLDVTE